MRARVRARIREARDADWRPWVVVFGLAGAMLGFGFVGREGRGWKLVPASCLLGVAAGAGVWAAVRNAETAPARPRKAARRQTLLEQLVDLLLLLVVAPLAAAAIALAVWGGIAIFMKLLE
jgi:hypothetical protein